MTRGTSIIEQLGLDVPIFQAPMAGVSTPEMAAAVSNAGALGAIGIGAASVEVAGRMMAQTRALTPRPFNVNVFCHRPAVANTETQQGWLAALAPEFARFGSAAPTRLREIYTSFSVYPAMQDLLCEARPKVVSFHFGLPEQQVVDRLKATGAVLVATATSLAEAEQIAAAGLDAIVAQGWQAGGHRGVFDPEGLDEQLDTLDLIRLLVGALDLPVIAAGGLMTGADIRQSLDAGAVAAQLGTAFVGCPESSADEGYRAALLASSGATVMTPAISGRPARCLTNRFTAWADQHSDLPVPDYPMAYDVGKALNAAAKSAGVTGFGAQWAGSGAARARAVPAHQLIADLAAERAAERTVASQ
ncbi:nitronate monooxygenase [Phaeobacter sp.]|uniref:NAD(P)H-dependent flavin oxidoreductase n=1 Tax=Phaeobacter sp. TaxID=1902409 RepID=UPI0025E1099C|nr:nitronate monooxygenase [Phaeobacter sp.]